MSRGGFTTWLLDLSGRPTIRWGNLAKLVGGSLIVTGSLGVTRVIQGLVSAWEMLLGGLAGFLTEYLWTLLGWPAKVGMAAWQAATEFVTSLGVFGGPLAIAIALGTLYIYQEASQQL